jgi:hypothetical protein
MQQTPFSEQSHIHSSPDQDQLRWAPECRFLSDAVNEKTKSFQKMLVCSEPEFDFAPFARESWELPDNSENSSTFNSELSPQAVRLLQALDDLHARMPIVGTKIMAILAATVSRGLPLQLEVNWRCCHWLLTDSYLRQERIELGLLLWLNWPERYVGPLNDLSETLLQLFVQEAVANPSYVLEQIDRIQFHNATRRNFFPDRPQVRPSDLSRFNSDFAVTTSDDGLLLLQLGEAVKGVDPHFAKSLFLRYLFHAALQFRDYPASADDLRKVASDIFALELHCPHTELVPRAKVLTYLIKSGQPDAVWWPAALEQLFKLAERVETREEKGAHLTTVALNSMPNSAIFDRAMAAYEQFAPDFRIADPERGEGGGARASTLIATMNSAAGYENNARNKALPPWPDHPIVRVAMNAYWECVDWLDDFPSYTCLMCLAEGITSGPDELSAQAVERLVAVFERLAPLSPQLGALIVKDMATSSQFVNWRAPREHYQARCGEVLECIFPIFHAIDPAAADVAKRAGLRHWSA